MTDQDDPDFRRKQVKALLTPAHQRTPEQDDLVALARPEREIRESAEASDPVSWLSGVEAVIAFGFAVVLMGPVARWLVGPGPRDLGFGGMIYLLAGFFMVLIGAAIVMAIVQKALSEAIVPRLLVDACAVLLLVQIAAPAQSWKPGEKRIEDGQRVSLWRAHREGWFDKPGKVAEAPPPPTGLDLRNAVYSDNLPAIEKILAQGVDVNTRVKDGETVLMVAAARAGSRQGRMETVRLLLDKGAGVNLRDRDGDTALLNAHGDPALVMLLAEHGADPNLAYQQNSVWTHLREADADTVIAIADKFPDIRLPVDEVGRKRPGPLHVFAREGNQRLVEYFLMRGLKAADADDWGNTPLAKAVSAANEKRRPEAETLELVEVLLAAGADVNAGSPQALPALTFAGPYPEIVRRLIAAGADVNAVIQWDGEKSMLDVYGKAAGADVLRAAGAKTAAELKRESLSAASAGTQ